MQRTFSTLDRCLTHLDRALRTVASETPNAARPYPGADVPDAGLSAAETRHAAGLMRVNHAGEVCAQALYSAQGLRSASPETRAHMEAAAAEETDHLQWCAERLTELDSRPSRLGPLWYGGSFLIGTAAGLAGDRWSFGFVMETERQVEAHLGTHLNRLPLTDERSRAVVRQMQADEARHGEDARHAGGTELPAPIPAAMAFCAGVMKFAAYRI